MVAWLTFPVERFRIVKGGPAAFHSTPPVTRTFCRDCGTPLTYVHADSPNTVDVTTCTLDDPDAFPPTHHSWLSHDVGWVKFGDGLPVLLTEKDAVKLRSAARPEWWVLPVSARLDPGFGAWLVRKLDEWRRSKAA